MQPNPSNTTEDERSLMIVTREEEYCFLYNRETLPRLVEKLLNCGRQAPSNMKEYSARDEEFLDADHFRSIALDVIGRRHSAI
ncbi:MAG TPA: hypothetical protein EYN00_00305 [Planctomycetes bacterium]|nr:hypothetical protein [Planctomycetota bacterium]